MDHIHMIYTYILDPYGMHMDMPVCNSSISMRVLSGEDKNCHAFGCTLRKSVQGWLTDAHIA